MGVRIQRGTIVIDIGDMELPDADGYEDAIDAIGRDVRGAISGACETYRQSLSMGSIELDEWEVMQRVAEVRLSASVTVHVSYDPNEGATPNAWASDWGWNYLAFESSDVDFDYEVVDEDASEDADVDADDAVENPVEAGHRIRRSLQDQVAMLSRHQRDMDQVVELAHAAAIEEDRQRFDVSHIALVTQHEGVEGLRGLTDDEVRAKAAKYAGNGNGISVVPSA